VVDHRSRYDIANVLSIIVLQGLKGNSNTLTPVVECWTPRIACIDGCINLMQWYTKHEFNVVNPEADMILSKFFPTPRAASSSYNNG
jgi:hypothetical protein